MSGLLHALQQGDNMFPNGSFAFSNGVEGMAALGQKFDFPNLIGLFETILRHRWANCDRIALHHAWEAASNLPSLAAVDEALEAATLPETLRNGSKANGAALVEAHARMGLAQAAALKSALDAKTLLGHLPVMQGALWRSLGLSAEEAIRTSGYLTLSGLGSAAIRLGEAGALTVQKALLTTLPRIETLAGSPIPPLSALAGALPWLDLACARQEQASLRLFAN